MIRNAAPLHPDSSKWYWFEWSDRELDGATVAASAWTVPAGLAVDADSFSGRWVGIKLSVATGQVGDEFVLENETATSGGETLHIQVVIKIRQSGH